MRTQTERSRLILREMGASGDNSRPSLSPQRSAQLGLPEADLEEAPSPDTEVDCPTLTSTEPEDSSPRNLRGLLIGSPLLRNCLGICQRREDIVKILQFSNEENRIRWHSPPSATSPLALSTGCPLGSH